MSTTEPQEIAFEDIRKGDDIEVQWRRGDTLETRRGVAHKKEREGFWVTKDERGLVGPPNPHVSQDRILLHFRPAPTEPKGLGAIMRTDEGVEYVSVNRKLGTRRWVEAELHEHSGRWALKWDEFDPDGIEVLDEGSRE